MKKTILSLLLSALMLLQMVPVFASSDAMVVKATFDTTLNATGMTATTPVAGVALKREERDGKKGWVLEGWEPNYHSVYMDLTGGEIRISGNSNVLVEVDYFDEAADGWFYIMYDSCDEKECFSAPQYTKGTKKWKTASFILEAPKFTNSVSGGDFAISTLQDKDYSMETVIIREVRVKELDEIKPASINLVTNRTGNVYFSDEEWVIGVETVNKLGTDFNANLNIILKDVWGDTVYEQNETLTLTGNGKETKEFKLGYDKFGVYTIYLEAENPELKYRFSANRDISYIKKSDFTNDRFGTNNKFGYESQADRNPDEVFRLLNKAGIGWSRDEIFWYEFEGTAGKFVLNDRMKGYMKSAQNHNIKQLIIFGYGHPAYTGDKNTFPSTEKGIEAFAKYAYELTTQLKPYGVTNFEILNEYNHWNAKRDLKLYDDICKAVAQEARRANPEVNIVGFTASGYNLIEWMRDVFGEGGGEYMDAVSYHDYAAGAPFSCDVGRTTKEAISLLETEFPKYKNMPIWKTEFGWSNGKKGSSWTNVSRLENTACYIPQEFAIQMASGAERIFQYSFMNWYTDNRPSIAELELCWGMISPHKNIKTPSSARPAYASIAAMNSFLGTPEFKSEQHFNDVNIYNFTRTQDGADVGLVWTEGTEKNVILNIPNASVEFFDFCGNKLEPAKNGDKYTFNLSQKHIYVVGKYETIEVERQQIFISDDEIKTVPGENISFYLYRMTNDKLNIEVVKNEESEIEILSIPSFDKKLANVKLKVNGRQGYKEDLRVRVSNEAGDIVFEKPLTIVYCEPLKISAKTKLYKSEDIHRWKMVFDVESYYHSERPRATLKIKNPKDFARFDVDLGEVKPGKNELSFHLPEISSFNAYKFNATFELDNGYKMDINIPIDFTLAFYAEETPKIDGVIEENEYITDGEFILDRKENYFTLMSDYPWRGKDDQSATTYLNWDDSYLYIASIVEDDIHSCTYEREAIWQADCIQLGINYGRENGSPSTTFTEIGYALNPEKGVQLYKFSAESGTVGTFGEGTEIEIKREGTKTCYEARFAWKDILPEGGIVEDGKSIAFAYMVNENDGYGRRGWVEYGSGLGDGKLVEKFARVTLVK